MTDARLIAAKNVVVPTLVDTTVRTATASYATAVAHGVLTAVSWFGRKIVFSNDVNESLAASKQGLVYNHSTETVAIKITNAMYATPEAISGLLAAGFQQLKSPTGLATVAVALSDTAVEKGCDLVEHFSKRKVSQLFVREPMKVAAAGGIYFATGAVVIPAGASALAIGTAALPAGASYLAYRIASHFAFKLVAPKAAPQAM